MTLIEDVENYFGTKDLYEVLGVAKEADESQIKKAYRKASLKIHPDRVSDKFKEEATKKFQVLAQVHFTLADSERRKLYDDHGIIANEDSLGSEADWDDYWRILFPKVTEKDINGFLSKYIGSEEEQKDLIAVYNRFEGDLDKISETHISYDEERTVEELNRLIKEGAIEKFDKFSKESAAKKAKRQKRADKEARQAAKVKKASEAKEMDSLTALIQKRSQQGFDSMISRLEAKYASKKRTKGVKRKHNDP